MTLPDLKLGDNGHVAAHKTIRGRVLNVLDFPSIQAAIDAAKASGRSSVYVPDGQYNITQTIQCAAGVDLVLSHGAILHVSADVDIVKPAPRGGVRGGVIDVTAIAFTKSAILIDGDSLFYMQPTMISDIQFIGGGTGTAIRFQAKQKTDTYPHIFGVIVNNFGISDFAYGVWMEVEETAGSTKFASINANQIGNGYFSNCVRAIQMNYIEAEPNNLIGIGGNQLSTIQVQPNANSTRAIYCEGSHNQFGLFVWDWTPRQNDPPAIELTARSARNMITTNLSPDLYSDIGAANRFITPNTLA